MSDETPTKPKLKTVSCVLTKNLTARPYFVMPQGKWLVTPISYTNRSGVTLIPTICGLGVSKDNLLYG